MGAETNGERDDHPSEHGKIGREELGMTEFVSLTCPSCGGKLQITGDIEQFACGYCGTEYVVKRGVGIVSLAPGVEELKRIQIGTDKMASELAIPRLRAELEELEDKVSEERARMSAASKQRGYGRWLIAAAIFGMMMLWLRSLNQQVPFLESGPRDQQWLGAVIVSFLVGVLTELGARSNRTKTMKRCSESIETLGDEIKEKRSQLERHEEIVSQLSQPSE
jgi:hypothetical protein